MTADDQPQPRPGLDATAWGEMLANVYRDIGDRTMRSLPIFNDALSVEAVGFRWFEGRRVGIMVTPWFMNVVMSADGGTAESIPLPGSTMRCRFPAGMIDFTIGEVAAVGRIATCSLFSPMSEFADMAAARAAAEAAFAALLAPASDEAPARQSFASAVDRRSFLRGVLTERRG